MRRPSIRPGSRAGALVWAAVTALTGSPLEGSPARVETPAAGAEVVVGGLVEVVWRPVPREAKEMELYLSLDGGRSYPLRVTPQLAPGLDRLWWHVPNLPSSTARLRLRVGIPGRGEVDAEPSPLFRIVAHGPVSAEPVSLRGGELWIGRGTDAPPRVPATAGDATAEVMALLRGALPGDAPRLPRGVTTGSSPYRSPLGHGPGPDKFACLSPRPGETTPRPLRR